MAAFGVISVLCALGLASGALVDRLSVIVDTHVSPTFAQVAFLSQGKVLKCADQKIGEWGAFIDIPAPSGVTLFSNPSSVNRKDGLIHVYVAASNGQVYTITQAVNQTGCSSFVHQPFEAVSSKGAGNLPFDAKAKLVGRDTLTALNRGSETYIFVRSQHTTSSLFYTVFNGKSYSKWYNLGGNLVSDASVVLNPFSNWFEAFANFKDAVYRTFQYTGTKWGSWRSASYYQPKIVTTTRPLAHTMDTSFFNGRLEIFALGTDGLMHHAYQTTCDKVQNPWGYCTWTYWYKIKNKVPPPSSSINGVDVGNNVHYGNELFTVGSDGNVWHSWQLKRGGDWYPWEAAGKATSGHIMTLPAITQSAGWWMANVVTTAWKVETITKRGTLQTSPASITFGGTTKPAFSVPADEATNSDWIGIYPVGAANDKYVDFRYVQGGQNPGSKPVTNGHVTLQMYLPKGKYAVRYLANRKYLNVMETGLEVTSGSTESEVIQLFQGIFYGMGQFEKNLTKCIKDGELTVQKFEESFAAFKNRKVYDGLNLFGQALKDVGQTFMDCEETEIALKLTEFVTALISCVEGDCVNFAIDIVKEIFIFYEDIYEIFGDIHAASNAFSEVKAYQQGGLCIGRVVAACLSMPTDVDKTRGYIARVRHNYHLK